VETFFGGLLEAVAVSSLLILTHIIGILLSDKYCFYDFPIHFLIGRIVFKGRQGCGDGDCAGRQSV